MDCFNEQLPFNSYEEVPNMPYSIISYLMENEEILWKLLKYDTPDALEKPNLTLDEKAKLIYKGIDNSDSYRVFRTPFIDDTFTTQCQMLRVFLTTLYPQNRTRGLVSFTFECINHIKLANLNGYLNRAELMVQRIIKCLNGKDINGVGVLFFDRSKSYYDVAANDIWNNRNFYGFRIIMTVNYGSLNE